MRKLLKIILITLVIFNVASAGMVPVKACAMPCCVHAKTTPCKDGAPAGVSASKRPCCEVKAGGSVSDSALASAVPLSGQDAVQSVQSQAALATAKVVLAPELMRPGPAPKPHSPPIYTLTSSYLC